MFAPIDGWGMEVSHGGKLAYRQLPKLAASDYFNTQALSSCVSCFRKIRREQPGSGRGSHAGTTKEQPVHPHTYAGKAKCDAVERQSKSWRQGNTGCWFSNVSNTATHAGVPAGSRGGVLPTCVEPSGLRDATHVYDFVRGKGRPGHLVIKADAKRWHKDAKTGIIERSSSQGQPGPVHSGFISTCFRDKGSPVAR